MTTEDRIQYWRKRLQIAAQLTRAEEVAACTKVVELLVGLRKAERAAEKAISRIVDKMPQEEYEAE